MNVVATLEIMTMSPRGWARMLGSTSWLSMKEPKAWVRQTALELGGIGVRGPLAAAGDPGVVHEDVDVTEVAEHRFDHAGVGGGVVDGRLVGAAAAARRLDDRDRLGRGGSRLGGN